MRPNQIEPDGRAMDRQLYWRSSCAVSCETVGSGAASQGGHERKSDPMLTLVLLLVSS
jgi:hypothetical protein